MAKSRYNRAEKACRTFTSSNGVAIQLARYTNGSTSAYTHRGHRNFPQSEVINSLLDGKPTQEQIDNVLATIEAHFAAKGLTVKGVTASK